MQKYRASQIIIENLKQTSVPWVHLVINQMIYDANGVLVNEIPREDRISKILSDIGTNMYTCVDPVTQKQITISGYGMASMITAYVEDCIRIKYGSN